MGDVYIIVHTIQYIHSSQLGYITKTTKTERGGHQTEEELG